MKPSEKLLANIKQQLKYEFSPHARIDRIITGPHQRSAGAWVWNIVDEETPGKSASQYNYKIGGPDRVTILVKCPKLGQYKLSDLIIVCCGCTGPVRHV